MNKVCKNACIKMADDPRNILWDLCKKFVEDNGIFHPEQVYQSDRIIERSYRFVEEICNVVGYAERPKEEEEEL